MSAAIVYVLIKLHGVNPIKREERAREKGREREEEGKIEKEGEIERIRKAGRKEEIQRERKKR